MTEKDFSLLSRVLQREYTLAACEHLDTQTLEDDHSVELFYSKNGNFFIELLINKSDKQVLLIKTFGSAKDLNENYLSLDISEIQNLLDY